MTIHLAADHAGFYLKQYIAHFLVEQGYHIVDHGAVDYDEHDDYPDYMVKAGTALSHQPETDRAIVFGGSGQGENMVMNKFSHVRSALYYGGNLEIVQRAREHNDANVLSLGARYISEEQARDAVMMFLNTSFSTAERHHRRVEKVNFE